MKASIDIMAKTLQSTYSLLSDNYGDVGKVEVELNILCMRLRKYKSQITKYITEILDTGVSKENLAVIHSQDIYCKYFDKMGDAISEHVRIWAELREQKQNFSDEAMSDLHLLMEAVGEVIDFTTEGYAIEKRPFLETITIFREAVSDIHATISSRHIKRLHSGVCNKDIGPLFMDLCYGLEKLIDNCDSIAEEQIDYSSDEFSDVEKYEEKRKRIFRLLRDKYRLLEMN